MASVPVSYWNGMTIISRCVRARFFPEPVKPLVEDARYYRRILSGLDEDQALQILGGQGAAPNSDDVSETRT
ncbi:uncharacterized protein ARMOST_04174 [Armillaria ostoyae]|uniref:Uncharacterized protein n=1 Tax=Armillaria ostoyae TaxID=47428 RepID=A0A284QWL0_ARMOS|nr:uncharacterized protein ARMOST_04174 [Armillaria ostoyae]